MDFFGINEQISSPLPLTLMKTQSSSDQFTMINNNFDGGNNQNYLTITSIEQQQQQQQSPTVMIRRGSFNKQTLKGFPSAANQSAANAFTVSMATGAALNQKSTFFKARKQFKNVFGGKNKIKQNSFDETPDLSRKNSLQDIDRLQQQQQHDNVIGTTMNATHGSGSGTGILSTNMDNIPSRKSRTILFEILKDGMIKFQFLLDSCTPGSIPDAQLVAAMLDLKAPVLARAAFLLECCHFVHR
ncbi:hypothetical protein BLA29_009474, partial [Euroglyphus maynei]